MYCRNYTGIVSCVLCREVCFTVTLIWRVHHRRFTVQIIHVSLEVFVYSHMYHIQRCIHIECCRLMITVVCVVHLNAEMPSKRRLQW